MPNIVDSNLSFENIVVHGKYFDRIWYDAANKNKNKIINPVEEECEEAIPVDEHPPLQPEVKQTQQSAAKKDNKKDQGIGASHTSSKVHKIDAQFLEKKRIIEYPCFVCKTIFTKEAELISHKSTQTSKDEKHCKCVLCGKPFKDMRRHKCHMEYEPKTKNSDGSSEQWKCRKSVKAMTN